MRNRIEHPWKAIGVYICIAAILDQEGVLVGTALIFCFFLGMAIYRLIV